MAMNYSNIGSSILQPLLSEANDRKKEKDKLVQRYREDLRYQNSLDQQELINKLNRDKFTSQNNHNKQVLLNQRKMGNAANLLANLKFNEQVKQNTKNNDHKDKVLAQNGNQFLVTNNLNKAKVNIAKDSQSLNERKYTDAIAAKIKNGQDKLDIIKASANLNLPTNKMVPTEFQHPIPSREAALSALNLPDKPSFDGSTSGPEHLRKTKQWQKNVAVIKQRVHDYYDKLGNPDDPMRKDLLYTKDVETPLSITEKLSNIDKAISTATDRPTILALQQRKEGILKAVNTANAERKDIKKFTKKELIKNNFRNGKTGKLPNSKQVNLYKKLIRQFQEEDGELDGSRLLWDRKTKDFSEWLQHNGHGNLNKYNFENINLNL